MIIKRNISFKPHLRKNKLLSVRMRVTYNANRIDIPLPFWVDASFWDEKEERAKKGFYNKGITTKDINRAIDEYKNCINEVFAKYEYEKIIPAPGDALKLFNELAGRKQPNEEENKDVFIFFDEFLSEGSTYWTDGTYRRLKSTKKHLTDFNPELTFGELTKNKLSEYVLFLREKNGLRNSTLKKEFSLLVWFLNWAVEKKYCANLEYQSFNPKLKIIKEKKVIFLTWKELMTLYNLEIPKSKNYLEKVRDVFCFCCFTSLRYSDVYNLKRTNITETTIDVITVKTIERIVIDLNKYSKSILEKYKGNDFTDEKALPVISNQKMNDYLKELGELAGLDSRESITYYKGSERIEEVYKKYELLTTHCGRRTFICNALAMGIPAHIVMKWTGHSDYNAMKPYIGVADEIKSELSSQ